MHVGLAVMPVIRVSNTIFHFNSAVEHFPREVIVVAQTALKRKEDATGSTSQNLVIPVASDRVKLSVCRDIDVT